VVSTGNANLIAKAMEARDLITTPIATLEKRYLNILIAQNPGNAFSISLSTFGFGELENKAERAVRRNVLAHEAISRFGSETGVFTNTPAEEFCIEALSGLKPSNEKAEVSNRFKARPDLMPHTLSDCLHELAYWNDLYRLRNAHDIYGSDGAQEATERDWFVFGLLAQIRPRSKAEAVAVFRYLTNSERTEMEEFNDILFNLVGGNQ
jgi:hypothetical protein